MFRGVVLPTEEVAVAFSDVVTALTEHWADVRALLGTGTADRLAALAGELGTTPPHDPRRRRLGDAIVSIIATLPADHPVLVLLLASAKPVAPAADTTRGDAEPTAADSTPAAPPPTPRPCPSPPRPSRRCRAACRSAYRGMYLPTRLTCVNGGGRRWSAPPPARRCG
ncbi:hypothetical protein SAMN05421505_10841 [Sinosporangium album]|uniref:Uncharacterized protein n=1 Tax=Sinosporangium album TaxID=504805 RepID=A0A1G7X4Z4_9ACTN|nr:hypothetical protein [Sinosporangium album]SDG79274.1 hypothetical protein SAMN05421505_10841 [Sinosporangium album]